MNVSPLVIGTVEVGHGSRGAPADGSHPIARRPAAIAPVGRTAAG